MARQKHGTALQAAAPIVRACITSQSGLSALGAIAAIAASLAHCGRRWNTPPSASSRYLAATCAGRRRARRAAAGQ
jgi:hypothetical protein